MYAWLWGHLPGPAPVRVLLAAALFICVVAVLFVWVFPWLEPQLPFTSVTVDTGTPTALSTALSTG